MEQMERTYTHTNALQNNGMIGDWDKDWKYNAQLIAMLMR